MPFILFNTKILKKEVSEGFAAISFSQPFYLSDTGINSSTESNRYPSIGMKSRVILWATKKDRVYNPGNSAVSEIIKALENIVEKSNII